MQGAGACQSKIIDLGVFVRGRRVPLHSAAERRVLFMTPGCLVDSTRLSVLVRVTLV